MEMESAVTSLVTGAGPGAIYKSVLPSVYCPDLLKRVGKKKGFFINVPALSFFFSFLRAANPLVP